MVYRDGTLYVTHASKKRTIMSKVNCNPEVETLKHVDSSETSTGFTVFWTSKLVCPPVTGEECSLTYKGALYDLSVLAKEDWNWLARNNIKEFGFEGVQFYFSVCKPLKNINKLANTGSRAAMKDKDGLVNCFSGHRQVFYYK